MGALPALGLALPLAFLLWLGARPAAGRAAFEQQAAGVGSALLALAAAGNFGTGTEPHLHAQRAPAPGAPPISGEPLPLRIEGRFLVRNDRLHGRVPLPRAGRSRTMFV